MHRRHAALAGERILNPAKRWRKQSFVSQNAAINMARDR